MYGLLINLPLRVLLVSDFKLQLSGVRSNIGDGGGGTCGKFCCCMHGHAWHVHCGVSRVTGACACLAGERCLVVNADRCEIP